MKHRFNQHFISGVDSDALTAACSQHPLLYQDQQRHGSCFPSLSLQKLGWSPILRSELEPNILLRALLLLEVPGIPPRLGYSSAEVNPELGGSNPSPSHSYTPYSPPQLSTRMTKVKSLSSGPGLISFRPTHAPGAYSGLGSRVWNWALSRVQH